MPPSSNSLGIALGILYLGLVVGIVWWMLVARPARHELDVKTWPKQNCIIVPLSGSKESKQVLDAACHVASERNAALVLVHVLEIPMTLGLNAPLDIAEERGRRILRDGEEAAREFNLRVETHLLRHRSTVLAVCELAQQIGAETIVMDAGTRAWWSLARLERNVELLRRAPCEVLIAKAAVTG